MRLGKQGEPVINNTNTVFEIGKAISIRQGDDLNIITTSNMLEIGNEICDLLKEKNINAGLISMHTIKPLDIELILKLLKTNKPLFSLEEHNIIGGLGSAVSEVIAESKFNPLFKRFGVDDQFSHYVGGHNYIRQKMGLTKERITEDILSIIK